MKKLYFLAVLFFALVISVGAQPKFGTPTPFQKTINALIGKIPINIAGNQIQITFEGDFWRGKLNGQDLLAGVFKITEGPDGSIITIQQAFLFADTGQKMPITNKPIAMWVDTPGPEIFFEYKKGPPVSFLPISKEVATAAIAAITGGAPAIPQTTAPAAEIAKPAPATPQVTAPAVPDTAKPTTPAIPQTTAPGAAKPTPATQTTSQPRDHDTIVLLNGDMLDVKVEEISATEIKYRRLDNLDGPLMILNKSEVLSIKFKNGTIDVINSMEQKTAKSTAPALDPKKLYFSLSLEPSGVIAGGPSATGELTKGPLNCSFHLSFPTLTINNPIDGFGFGVGAGLNYFWSGKIGGFFLGGLFEWSSFPNSYSYTVYHPYDTYNYLTDSYTGKDVKKSTDFNNFVFALNGGYKFITNSGIYFRTGIALGVSLSMFYPLGFYYKPDIAVGYIF